VLEAWGDLPASVLAPERNRRQHLSSVLSRNEVDRDYAYNRRLFKRVGTGWYQFNPALAIRRRTRDGEVWQPVYAALNLPLVHELAHPKHWALSQALWKLAGGAELPVPVAGERWWQRDQAELERLLREADEHRRAQPRPAPLPDAEPPRWGTPAAKRAELERVRRQIEANRRARGEFDDF